jgi:superkiller protein 3
LGKIRHVKHQNSEALTFY